MLGIVIEDKVKSKVIQLSVLSITFVIMIAALMYNGNRYPTADIEELATVSGMVTDDSGAPVADAQVIVRDSFGEYEYTTNSDVSGHYELVYTSAMIGNEIGSSKDGYWYQWVPLDIVEGVEEVYINLTIIESPVTTVPAGPIVLVSTLVNSSLVEVSTYTDTSIMYLAQKYGIGEPSEFAWWGNHHYNSSSTDGLLTYQAFDCLLSGGYGNISGENVNETFLFDYLTKDGAVVEENVTLSEDYLAADEVTSNYSIYTLKQGENVTITAVPGSNYLLPKALWLESMANVLGGNVTLERSLTLNATKTSTSYASVTITALTPGTHTYKVFIEGDFIIHVWEVE